MQNEVRPRVVFVDDEPAQAGSWERTFRDSYDVAMFTDSVQAAAYFDNHDVDIAVLDLQMPKMDGMTLLQRLREKQPNAVSLMLTGVGSIDAAVKAMKLGANDFLTKPIEDIEILRERLRAAAERRQLILQNQNLRSQVAAFTPNTELIGECSAIQKVKDLIGQISNADAPILVCGESGTGKELVARAIHRASDRRDKAFIAVNCAAFTESIIDSELFGHERGSFTGADSTHRGLFEAAHHGTLFLDEIGDVPLSTQVRLLRALQEGEIRPVGSTKSHKIDVRIITATNVDLAAAMQSGQFRDDLYYRISTFRVDIPPLRERDNDVLLIAQYLLTTLAKRASREVTGFSEDALVALKSYRWPGNVRELYNLVQYALTLCRGPIIEPTHFPSYLHTLKTPPLPTGTSDQMNGLPYSEARAAAIAQFDRQYLTDIMNRSQGNISQASRTSGIDRANLRRLLNRYQLEHLKLARTDV